MITQNSLDLLKSRIDILDTVGSYLELKKAGANYIAPCPFHDEKSGSFTVSPQKQIYHCFGCGAHGDAIGFIQEDKKLTFAEAVEDIANDLNFTLQYDTNTEAKKDYSKLMENINLFYMGKRTNEIDSYLRSRGVTEQSIRDFEIGYAPDSSSQLYHLQERVFSIPEAIECGVCASDENGRTYARLTDRISFPIRNHTGKLIGFGGRILSGDRAKYINSPQTPLFDKSRNLYGYNLAKPHIHEKGTFTITEGYLDVVMFHQAGIRTAVATMGTALTAEHCMLIKKSGAKVLLCYDGDKAGITAAFKASKLLSANGIYGGVVIFPEGKDPADMVRDGNIEELHSFLKRPQPLIRFAINHISAQYRLELPNEKESALKEITTYLNTLTPLIQDEYKSIVAGILSIDPRHVTTAPIVKTPVARLPDINVSELNIIKTARENPFIIDMLVEIIDMDYFTTHKEEYAMLLSNDSRLDGLLLRDELSIYSNEEFTKQVAIFQMNYWQKRLKSIPTMTWDFTTKSKHIVEINDRICKLQKTLRGAA
jgi:DNA primase